MNSLINNAPGLTAADDDFHRGEELWRTEGSWWSFHIADKGLAGWIYHHTRLNLGIASGGVWVWDARGSICFEQPYYLDRQIQPIGEGPHDLNDFTWPDGTRQQTLAPLSHYRLRCEDAPRIALDLEYRAVLEPAVTCAGTPPAPVRFEQACHVTGTLDLLGERHRVDCIALRDHSWGVRPERPSGSGEMPEPALLAHRGAPYIHGAASAEDAFFALVPGSGGIGGGAKPASGYLVQGGRRHAISAVEQRSRRSPLDGHIETIELDIHGDGMETVTVIGRTISWIMRPSASGVGMIYFIEWSLGGLVAFGEVQDVWPVDQWSAYRRSLSPR